MILLVGNWKAAPEKKNQAEKLFKETVALARTVKKYATIVVAAPYLYIPTITAKKTAVAIAAQTVSLFDTVPHTGEVTAAMLKSIGATYTIVGHSECRADGDTNEQIAQKVTRLFEKNLIPILCVGELERDNQGWYLSTIKEQLSVVLLGVSVEKVRKIVIAYEPVWAIGKNATRQATPIECREMVIFIRKILTDMHTAKVAQSVKILYGGSVDEMNASQFISEGNADGLLVGRVSLEPKRFALLAKTLNIKKPTTLSKKHV